MVRVVVELDTTVPADRVRAALLDFGPGRPLLWSGLHPDLYVVHDLANERAVVTEGSRILRVALWAREHYDWTSPESVSWTTAASNFCRPGSHASLAALPTPSGGSHIRVEWVRVGTGLRGRLAMTVVRATRGRLVRRSVEEMLRILVSARDAAVTPSG